MMMMMTMTKTPTTRTTMIGEPDSHVGVKGQLRGRSSDHRRRYELRSASIFIHILHEVDLIN